MLVESCCSQCVMSWSCGVSCWFSGQCLASVCGQRVLSCLVSCRLCQFWSVCHVVISASYRGHCVMSVVVSVSCLSLIHI